MAISIVPSFDGQMDQAMNGIAHWWIQLGTRCAAVTSTRTFVQTKTEPSESVMEHYVWRY